LSRSNWSACSFLSKVNLRKVCNYISQRSKTDFQCIVISLKDMFYERSDSLVGVCKDVGTSSSLTLTLDLTQYDKNEAKNKGKKRKGGKKRKSDEAEREESAPKRKTRRSAASENEKEECSDAETPSLKRKARRSSEADMDEEDEGTPGESPPPKRKTGSRAATANKVDEVEMEEAGEESVMSELPSPEVNSCRDAPGKAPVDDDADEEGESATEPATQPESQPPRGRGRKTRKSAAA
jgi:hypothetical protein